MYQSILFPTPGTFTVIAEGIVPEGVLFAAITQVVVNQMKGVFARFPVEGAPTAFAFCLHILVLGVFGTYFRQYLSSFPLKANSLNALRHAWIGKYFINIVIAVGIESTKVESYFRMALL